MQMLPEKLKTRVIRPPQSPGEELDRELARGMLDGSRQSLGYFVDRHLGPLTHYLERRLGRYAEEGRRTKVDEQGISSTTDDVVQQIVEATFRDAVHHLRSYAIGIARTPMRLWLIRRAERYVRNFARTKDEGHAIPIDNDSQEVIPHSALRILQSVAASNG